MTPPAPSAVSGNHEVVCPSCKARVLLRSLPREVVLRCAACRGEISGSGSLGREERWLYPVPEAAPARDATWEQTAATLDPDGEFGSASTVQRIGRYEIRGQLGHGGMGVVYDAWDDELQRAVALKVLMGGRFATPAARTRFIGEARAAARLDHPGIVRVLDIGVVEDRPFFTMEKVFGPSLRDVIDHYGPIPPKEAARLVESVARATHLAHTSGIAHRDLKPGNVLLESDGTPRVTDFGLAKPLDEERDLTATHAVLGTPAYMAPEIARGDEDIDWIGVDVYGLGALLFAALSGRPPTPGAIAQVQLKNLREGERASLADGVPVSLGAVVDHAMRPQRGRRYGTAAEVADELERFLSGEPVRARPESSLARLRRRMWRRRRSLGAGLAGVAALVAIALAPELTDRFEMVRREARAAQAWADVQERLDLVDRGEASGIRVAFAEAPAHRGTVAAARAWLEEGDVRAARAGHDGNVKPGVDPQLAAWSRALASTSDPEVRAEVLLRLARTALDTDDLDSVLELRTRMSELPLTDAQRGESLLLGLHASLFSGRTAVARALWEQARELGVPGVERFADPARLPSLLDGYELLPERAVGRFWEPAEAGEIPKLHLVKRDEVVRVELVPKVRVLDRVPREGSQPGGVWTPEGPRRSSEKLSGAVVDLDGDGVKESYYRQRRSLLRQDLTATGVVERPASAAIEAANSEVGTVQACDLDQDGQPELLVGLGEWSAYDLRLYEAAHDGELKLRSRLTQGAISAARTVEHPAGPRLITTSHHRYPSRVVFGEERPAGPAPAITLWKLEGDDFVALDTWQMPTSAEYFDGDMGDVDGDGVDELLVMDQTQDDSHSLVFWLDETASSFEVSVLHGLQATGLHQLDDDPAEEMVVTTHHGPLSRDGRERSFGIAGRGEGRLPVPDPPPQQPTVSVPLSLQGTEAAPPWEAARLLARAGLPRQAASILEDVAGISEAEQAIAAEQAAARLWDHAGVPGRSAGAAARAAHLIVQRGGSPSVFEDAIHRALDAADPELALRLADDWRASDGHGPTAELADTLESWREASHHRVRLGPGLPLDDGWQIIDPLALDPRGGELRVHSYGLPDATARLPLRWRDGPAWVTLEFTVLEEEWSSVLTWGLTEGQDLVFGRTGANGGGGLISSMVNCGQGTGDTSVLARTTPRDHATPQTATVRMARAPGSRTWRCVHALPAEGRARSGEADFGIASSEGALSLEGYERQLRYGARTTVRVDRVEIWGVEPLPASNDPLHQGHLALVRGEPAEALRLLPEHAHVSRAMALAQLRRPVEAVEALRVARGSDTLRRLAPSLLRTRGDTFAPLMREALGADYLPLFEDVWGIALGTRRDEDWLRDLLQVELAAEQPVLDDATHPSWRLLAARADVLLRTGSPDRAVRAATRWLEDFSQLEDPPDDLRSRASELHRQLSLLAERHGREEDARHHAELSVEVSPAPLLARDRFTRGR